MSEPIEVVNLSLATPPFALAKSRVPLIVYVVEQILILTTEGVYDRLLIANDGAGGVGATDVSLSLLQRARKKIVLIDNIQIQVFMNRNYSG